eukprot:884274-Pelagomonas_calceolata.AAC.1
MRDAAARTPAQVCSGTILHGLHIRSPATTSFQDCMFTASSESSSLASNKPTRPAHFQAQHNNKPTRTSTWGGRHYNKPTCPLPPHPFF